MFNMSKEHAIITLDNANVNSDEENAPEVLSQQQM